MKRILLFSMFAVVLLMSVTAFQCASTEMTSAKLYIQQKNYPKAIEALQKEIQKNPKSDEGYYFLGYLYGEQGDYVKMMDNFNTSLSISKKFEKQITDNKKYYWGQNFNKGVAFFNKAAKSKGDSVSLNMDKAISSFKECVMIEPDSADTYKNLAFALLQANRADEAISPMEKLIKVRKAPDNYRVLGQIYASKGSNLLNKYKESKVVADSTSGIENLNKAIAVLEEGRKYFPEDQEILLYLSNAYIAANKADVAMDAFKAGVEKDPKNQYYRYNYGTLLLQANKYEEAVNQFTKAVELEPTYANALFNLAVSYVKWGTALREQSDKEGKENSEYKKKYEQALPFLQKVTELKPDDGLFWETLAKVYAVLGKTAEANDAFKKADQTRK